MIWTMIKFKIYLSICKTFFPILLAAAATIDSIIPINRCTYYCVIVQLSNLIYNYQCQQLLAQSHLADHFPSLLLNTTKYLIYKFISDTSTLTVNLCAQNKLTMCGTAHDTDCDRYVCASVI